MAAGPIAVGPIPLARYPLGRRRLEMRRVLFTTALILGILGATLTPAAARPKAEDRPAPRPILADRDGDAVDDVLEARLRRSDAGIRHAVVVATDGSVDVPRSRRAVGAFPVSFRYGIIHGFAARLTSGQIRALGIIAGIDWCAQSPEVDVISMSLGSAFPSDGSDALSQAANNAVVAHNKVVTVAAGNSGDAPDTIGSPGAAPDAITVGASSSWSAAPAAANHSDGVFLAFFSSRGGSMTAAKPDIVAPGYNVTAANANTGAGYIVHSGTSMATPFAAGAAALALQGAPGWSPAPVQSAMDATAEDYGPAGKDPDWGAGLLDVLALSANARGGTDSPTFPTHAHVAGPGPDGGDWNHSFQVSADDLDVPIAATVIIGGQCQLFFPGFGCLDPEWSPDLDAALFDPTGTQISLSQCMSGTACGFGRQETLHAMPTVAGTYRIRVYAYLGSPNNGTGGTFDLDLSTGPVGTAPPPPPPPPPPTPSVHVGDLDRSAVRLNSTTWRARVTIRVHDAGETPLAGVLVTGQWGTSASVSCTTQLSDGTAFCVVSRDLKKARASITFRVLGLSKGGYVYSSTDNHDEVDEDGSNGTTITVNRPF